tara:strand:- start:1851 stop:2048 length:198 start_codon:yes stop_codon:yes gene_type:complete
MESSTYPNIKPIDEIKLDLKSLKKNISEIQTDLLYIKHHIEKLILEEEKKEINICQAKQQGWFWS